VQTPTQQQGSDAAQHQVPQKASHHERPSGPAPPPGGFQVGAKNHQKREVRALTQQQGGEAAQHKAQRKVDCQETPTHPELPPRSFQVGAKNHQKRQDLQHRPHLPARENRSLVPKSSR